MEYFFLKGFLVLLLTKHCTSDGLPTSNHSSTVTLEATQTSLPAEVVAPPSLEEVQQAVQEASEKVEDGAAEEVLMELLERVVEAALGQVEGKRDEQEEEVEDETGVEVSEQMVEGMDDAGEGEQKTKEGEEEGTVADNMEATTVGVDAVGTEAVLDEFVDAKITQEVVEETVAPLEELDKKDVMLNGRVESQTTQMVQEVDFGGEPVQEIAPDSDQSLVADHIGTVGAMEEVAPAEGELLGSPSDTANIEPTHPVLEDPIFIIENYTVKDPQSHVEEEMEAIEIEDEELDSNREESHQGIIKQEYEVLVNGEDEQQAGVNVTLQTSNDLIGDPEATVIFPPEPEDDASIGQRPKNQLAPAPSTIFSEVAESVFTDHGNEILYPTDDLLTRPTLSYFGKDVLAMPPHPRGQLVEDTAGNPETKEMGLEAWKTGTTIIAVFLVLETIVIIVYIFKCRNKNRRPARQHSCEEGCVEAEVTTGAESSDDTLHAGNGDTQQHQTKPPNTKEHKGEHVISMSNLPDGPTVESANAGPGPDSSQELRTSML
ncbi:uncharacterized protein si:dkeyp-118a3.2 [Syngnathus typhle]|uniref:uncharacterized protein si:dkeyp-118a3.2 n=1 Tax=Syngnathus typhle TaxID=161592 RepID=UPI002A6B2B1A|nr:uncharacterized protein si:dkeyp-118a3.2 [Syngnathus typhle]